MVKFYLNYNFNGFNITNNISIFLFHNSIDFFNKTVE